MDGSPPVDQSSSAVAEGPLWKVTGVDDSPPAVAAVLVTLESVVPLDSAAAVRSTTRIVQRCLNRHAPAVESSGSSTPSAYQRVEAGRIEVAGARETSRGIVPEFVLGLMYRLTKAATL